MKIKISQAELQKGIQIVYPIVPNKATLPILAHILLEAKDGKLRLAGTDLEIGISHTIPVEVIEEGAIAIPAKRLNDLIKELPDIPLSITTRKNYQTTIDCEKGVFKVMGLPKEEFPKIHSVSDKDGILIDPEVLEDMLELTTFAVSHDETRYVLNGILFISNGEQLRFVATDGRRLASIERTVKKAPKGEQKAIIPLKALVELRRLIGGQKKTSITIKENQASFDIGETQLVTRLIEGVFPDYDRVIPEESPQKMSISKENFLLTTRRISLWTTQESPSIRLDLKPDKLTISKQTPEVGEAQEALAVKYSGDEFSVGFNPNYLIDVLKALPEEEIQMELPGPDKPGVIRTKDQYLYVVLPMQLSQ